MNGLSSHLVNKTLPSGHKHVKSPLRCYAHGCHIKSHRNIFFTHFFFFFFYSMQLFLDDENKWHGCNNKRNVSKFCGASSKYILELVASGGCENKWRVDNKRYLEWVRLHLDVMNWLNSTRSPNLLAWMDCRRSCKERSCLYFKTSRTRR